MQAAGCSAPWCTRKDLFLLLSDLSAIYLHVLLPGMKQLPALLDNDEKQKGVPRKSMDLQLEEHHEHLRCPAHTAAHRSGMQSHCAAVGDEATAL